MFGKVCFFSPQGWGYIRPDADLPDIYFHRSGLLGPIQRKLISGLTVEFDVAERLGKPIAVNVQIPEALSKAHAILSSAVDLDGGDGGDGNAAR